MSDEWYFTIHGTKRVFWGIEHLGGGWVDSARRISLAWMQEMEKPYRVGRALRVRIHHRAFHIGLCRLSERPPGREMPEVDIDAISEHYSGLGAEIWES